VSWDFASRLRYTLPSLMKSISLIISRAASSTEYSIFSPEHINTVICLSRNKYDVTSKLKKEAARYLLNFTS
jgi:hypothetical protein